MTDVVVFVLEEREAALLEECVRKLAEAKLDEAEDAFDEKAAKALDSIADRIHSALEGVRP
jgi:hypothetical protein